jgi:hypothetical protein
MVREGNCIQGEGIERKISMRGERERERVRLKSKGEGKMGGVRRGRKRGLSLTKDF